jgi:hypothetical protein
MGVCPCACFHRLGVHGSLCLFPCLQPFPDAGFGLAPGVDKYWALVFVIHAAFAQLEYQRFKAFMTKGQVEASRTQRGGGYPSVCPARSPVRPAVCLFACLPVADGCTGSLRPL